ncbi:MAG: endolytic transglycosylase MltG [Calditrichia bacterium]
MIGKLDRVAVEIPRGSSLRQIADILKQKGALQNETLFVLLGKITDKQTRLQAGYFWVPKGLHPWQLLNYLTRPEAATVRVTIPEGKTLEFYASVFSQKLGTDSSRFMQLVTDSSFCKQLGVQAATLEGYLLPETYFLPKHMDEESIIKYLVQQTEKIFQADTVLLQLKKLNMTVHQILTLASIIEGEAMVDSERVVISSVYHNRLRKGWHLRADPTIQYILPGKPRRLLFKHLEIDSPYNTYLYKGLPPGPINNPGKRSILAALFPAQTDYLYFVARGDGGHYFSRTGREHAKYKAMFDEVRRKVRLQQKMKKQK